MRLTADEIRTLVSENLLRENLDAVVEEVQAMQEGRGMIAADHAEPLLQGDVFDGVPWIIRQQQLEVAYKRALLISNSCDSTPDNPRQIPLDIAFAPVLRLSRYRDMLVASGAAGDKIENAITSIKRQEKTNLIYLPVGAKLVEEMVVLLDQVQSLPHSVFAAAETDRLAVLTQRGFWILLLKLSMHFLRPHEGAERQAA